MGMRPGWVGGLVEESFFVGCAAHENRKKNEKNIFCLGCCASICPHCAPAHRHHLLIQVLYIITRWEHAYLGILPRLLLQRTRPPAPFRAPVLQLPRNLLLIRLSMQSLEV
jgi:hypothetical protein